MMEKIIAFLFFIIFPLVSNISQEYSTIELDTLNKFNKEGEKSGYWIEFLKKNLRATSKKDKAVFFRYVYYQDGKRFETLIIASPLVCKVNLQTNGNKLERDKIIMLDGTYYIYNKKGNKLVNEFQFKKGHLSKLTNYFDNGQMSLYVDMEKKKDNYNYSYYVIMYNEDGESFLEAYHVLKNGKFRFVD